MLRAPAVLLASRQLTITRSTALIPASVRCAASSASAALAKEEHQSTVRPFSEMPMPSGAVPLLGHVPLLRKNTGKKRLDLFQRSFDELGPIFRLKLPGTITL